MNFDDASIELDALVDEGWSVSIHVNLFIERSRRWICQIKNEIRCRCIDGAGASIEDAVAEALGKLEEMTTSPSDNRTELVGTTDDQISMWPTWLDEFFKPR